MPPEDESRGTQILLARLADFLPTLLQGGLVVVDELDTSLHPDLCVALVRRFTDPPRTATARSSCSRLTTANFSRCSAPTKWIWSTRTPTEPPCSAPPRTTSRSELGRACVGFMPKAASEGCPSLEISPRSSTRDPGSDQATEGAPGSGSIHRHGGSFAEDPDRV
ncbi:MAG: ATP-binding protein [Polyangiaceae bacterium]|nr:ATP-binding protein [Polyangiaceae bacterium]